MVGNLIDMRRIGGEIVGNEITSFSKGQKEQLLQESLQKRKDITLILLKGLHVNGMIRGYDTFSVLIEFEGKQQLVYKHAISTILK